MLESKTGESRNLGFTFVSSFDATLVMDFTHLDREALVFAVVAVDDRRHPDQDSSRVTELPASFQDC